MNYNGLTAASLELMFSNEVELSTIFFIQKIAIVYNDSIGEWGTKPTNRRLDGCSGNHDDIIGIMCVNVLAHLWGIPFGKLT